MMRLNVLLFEIDFVLKFVVNQWVVFFVCLFVAFGTGVAIPVVRTNFPREFVIPN